MVLIDSQLEAAHAQLEDAETKIKAGRAEYDKQFKNFGNMVSNSVMGTLSSEVGSAVEVVRKQAEALLLLQGLQSRGKLIRDIAQLRDDLDQRIDIPHTGAVELVQHPLQAGLHFA